MKCLATVMRIFLFISIDISFKALVYYTGAENVLGSFKDIYNNNVKHNCMFYFTPKCSNSLALYIDNLTKDHAPFGFKLNSNLDDLFRNMTLASFRIQKEIHYMIFIYIIKSDILVWIIYASKFLGLSFLLSISFDLITIASVSTRVMHFQFKTLCSLQLKVLICFFRLFLGKKNNILRNRVDAEHFEFDQIFLGSIIFIVSFFLFETTLFYFLFFFCLQLIVIISHFVNGLFLSFLLNPLSLKNTFYNYFQTNLNFNGPIFDDIVLWLSPITDN
eukprot:snap_masked-scaffold_84-processed-gene-0.26-mRNA-1 protein AED:1.00 eAED:1.00 QI:0/0/0/0/1/1/2/0/274